MRSRRRLNIDYSLSEAKLRTGLSKLLEIDVNQSVTEPTSLGSQNDKTEETKENHLKEWKWSKPSNTNLKVSGDGKTVSSNGEGAYCYGSLVLTSSIHYFTLLFDKLLCCVNAGIYQADIPYEEIKSSFLRSINLPESFGITSYDAVRNIEVGFLVDMEKNSLIITDHKAKIVKKVVKFEDTWKKVSPLLLFKHRVAVKVIGCINPVPEWVLKQ